MVAADTRAEIQTARILNLVGFRKDSLAEFDIILASLNSTIDAVLGQSPTLGVT